MNKQTQERIEELKKEHGQIFEATIIYKNADGEQKEIRFLHRAPMHVEYEQLQRQAIQGDPVIAARNMVASIIIDGDPAATVKELSQCPIAFDRWFSKAILPFFGGDVVEAQSRKL